MNKFINKTNKPLHGGDLTSAAKEFGVSEKYWIDLSTGINSTCYPKIDVNEKTLRALPTAYNLECLLEEARKYYRVGINSSIMAGPGTQSLIQNLPILFPDEKVYIISPTYSEHAYTWKQAGNLVTLVTKFKEIPRDVIAVLVNPNNPNGYKYQTKDILALSKILKLLIVDEAFCDLTPDLSVIPHLSQQKILVLRSLGKFYGLAGLRLGFAIGTQEITQQLTDRLGPWAVSGPAIEIGTRALSDNAWISMMLEFLSIQSTRLNSLLEKYNLPIIGKTGLFTLISTNNAAQIFEALARASILVRKFDEHPHWLRIGLPGAENEWFKLERVLKSVLYSINNMRE